MIATLLAVFLLGVVAGQGMVPARAQAEAPMTEERAAAIKESLRERIRWFNVANAETASARVPAQGFNPWTEIQVSAYWGNLDGKGIVEWAINTGDPVLQHYLRYVYVHVRTIGVLEQDTTAGEYVLRERFLDHFSRRLVATGMPPVAPPFSANDQAVARLHSKPSGQHQPYAASWWRWPDAVLGFGW